MMKTKTFIVTGILGLFFCHITSVAQEVNCGDKYSSALSQYNYGLADSALAILEPCLFNSRVHKQLSNDESVNIYRLAALSSIMIGDPENAERYVRQLLQYKPDYAKDWREGDLMEFRNMIESITSQPLLRLGIKGGMNTPFLSLKKYYTDPEKPASTFSLKSHIGFQLWMFSEISLSRNVALEAGIGVSRVSFDYQFQSYRIDEYMYEQEIDYLEVPVLAKYYIPLRGALKPYLQGGISGKFSLNQRENSDEFGKHWFTESTDGNNILATFVTDFENIGIAVGGGFTYDLKKISLQMNVCYAHHLNSNNKLAKFDEINGYEDIPSGEPFGYTNDINLITLSHLQIALGIAYNLKYKVF